MEVNPYQPPDGSHPAQASDERFQAIYASSPYYMNVAIVAALVAAVACRLLFHAAPLWLLGAAFAGAGVAGWFLAAAWGRRELQRLRWKLPVLKSGMPRIGGPAEKGYLFITDTALVLYQGALKGKGYELEIPLTQIHAVDALGPGAFRIRLPDGRPQIFGVSSAREWARLIATELGLRETVDSSIRPRMTLD